MQVITVSSAARLFVYLNEALGACSRRHQMVAGVGVPALGAFFSEVCCPYLLNCITAFPLHLRKSFIAANAGVRGRGMVHSVSELQVQQKPVMAEEGGTAIQLQLLPKSYLASSWRKEWGWGTSFIGSRRSVSSGLFLPVLPTILRPLRPSLEHSKAWREAF